MTVATFVEISIVVEARHGAEGLRDLDHFVEWSAGIELVAVGTQNTGTSRVVHSAVLGGAGTEPL